jgi:putative ABC transport system ATP-binding protein
MRTWRESTALTLSGPVPTLCAAVLTLRDLSFRYRDSGFTLTLPEFAVAGGERAAIIGPSGCGKTTLLHLIAGILQPDGGTIEVERTNLAAMDDAARRSFRIRRIGLVFQEFELIEYLDVLDNILLPCRLHPDLPLTGEARDRACALAERVGLGEKLHRPIRGISHGERQRTAICRALVASPALILADEPTGNLDPENRAIALDLLEQYSTEHNAALVVATHDHELLHRFTRVLDMATVLG